MTIKTRHGRKRNGNVKTFPPELLKKLPPPAPAQERPEPDTLGAKIDNRIDERFDGETTRSSLAILLSAFAVVMAAVAAITIVFVAGDDGNTGTTEACLVQWDTDAQEFRDCEGTAYPVDGRGLPQYPVRVDDDGDLFVDPSP